jgi:hypothetical protein
MAGKHSKRRGAHAQVSQQRGPRPVGIVDAPSGVEHLVTDASVMQHRHSGRYLALCGARLIAASMTEPGRGQCRECAR